jgi:membrane-associated protein
MYILLPAIMAAAWLGNTVGFFTGRYMGPRLFNKEDSLFFKRKYLIKTKEFYDDYGSSMLIVGRFLPYIRTFAPIMAGAIQMSFRQFNLFNFIGAVLWVGSMVTFGFIIGKIFPGLQNHIDYIIYGFLLVTSSALVIGYLRTRRKKSVKE